MCVCTKVRKPWKCLLIMKRSVRCASTWEKNLPHLNYSSTVTTIYLICIIGISKKRSLLKGITPFLPRGVSNYSWVTFDCEHWTYPCSNKKCNKNKLVKILQGSLILIICFVIMHNKRWRVHLFKSKYKKWMKWNKTHRHGITHGRRNKNISQWKFKTVKFFCFFLVRKPNIYACTRLGKSNKINMPVVLFFLMLFNSFLLCFWDALFQHCNSGWWWNTIIVRMTLSNVSFLFVRN